MKSIWSETPLPRFEGLDGDIKTDVLIIGGGICGILCGFMLKNSGVECTVVEAERICRENTLNTTAKITSQHSLIYDKIIREYGLERARLYLKAQQDAIDGYRQLCGDNFTEKSAFVYSRTDNRKLEKELAALEKIGFKACFKKELPLPFSVSGAIEFKNQGEFNPIKFIEKAVKGLNIYENTRITEIRDGVAFYDKGKIKAKKIIVATHFPFINKHGSYFIKMFQHRSYVVALENAPKLDGMYVDENKKGFSFRNYGDYLLLGGGSHRTGIKGEGWQPLHRLAKRYYKGSKIAYEWAAQDCISLDGIPYIGQYSANTPNLYVATGFNKWGMTNSMVAAKLLRDLVLEKENEYTALFSPARSILHPQLAVNGAEAVLNILTPTVPRCPHLGCALKYNKFEHTWDCPCHGSRFANNGKLINNPANGDLKS